MSYVAVTTARNEDERIASTVESVLNQTIPPKFYVVVDDRSTDATADVVKQYPVKYLKIHGGAYFLASYNMCRALKAGVEHATKLCPGWDFLLKIDADSVIPPDYVEQLMDRMKAERDIAIGSGVMRGGKIWVGRASNGAPLYRREAWDDIGGLDWIIHWDTHAIIKCYWKRWVVRTFNDVVYEEVRTHERERLYEWYLTGMTRHLLGFPFYHTFGVAVVYLRKRPPLVGSLVMVLTHLFSILLGWRRPFSKGYYAFTKGFAYRETRVRFKVVLGALTGGRLW